MPLRVWVFIAALAATLFSAPSRAFVVSVEVEDKDHACVRWFAPGWVYDNWQNLPDYPATTVIGCSSPDHNSRSSAARDVYCPKGYTLVGRDTKPLAEWYCEAPTIRFSSTKGKPCPFCQDQMDPGDGNKFQEETDYVGQGPFPLQLVRRYNSLPPEVTDSGGRSKYPGGFGDYWTHEYERGVTLASEATTIVTAAVRRQDGRTLYFTKQGEAYVSESVYADRLEKLVDGSGALSGWRYTSSDKDEVELYDAAGKLLSITNRAGVAISLAYDASGRLATVTDPFGRQIAFAYNADNHISSASDPSGATYTYTYGTNNNLASVTAPGSAPRTYQYENSDTAMLTGITDENGQRVATWSYAPHQGATRVYAGEHAGGAGRVDFTAFSNDYSTMQVRDAFGSVRTYLFQAIQGLQRNTGITGPACPTCGPAAQSFDANGNVASRADWNGNRTNFTYDLARNLETSRIEGLTSAGATTAQTRTISTEWDAAFRLPARIAEPLRITTHVYDADGTQCGARGALCSRSIQATGDADGSQGFSATPSGAPRTWTYTYNSAGQVLTMNGPRTDVADVTSYTYDAQSNLSSISNALGHTTSIIAYNAHGQPLTLVDPNGVITTLGYDARQRLISRSFGGETTSYDYDAAGQLTKVTLPDGSYLSYSYDAAHRLTGLQDNLGNRIAYTLDAMGNRTQEQVLDPASALAQTRSRVYSSLNRLFQELGAQGQTTEYAYDSQGNVTLVKDPLNRSTANLYDGLNRLKQVNQAATFGPTTTTLSYRASAFPATGDLSSTSRDCPTIGALFAEAWNNNPTYGGGTFRYAYQQNTCSGPTFNATVGSTLTFRLVCTQGCGNTYIVDTSVVGITISGGETNGGAAITRYDYNGLDALTQVTDPRNLVTGYTVDGLGNLALQSSPDTGNTANTYDAAGNLLTQTDAKGQVTSYAYDALNRVTLITFHDGARQAYAYDQGANGIGRLSSITETNAASQQTSITQYAYEPHGRVTAETRTVNGMQYTVAYGYDSAGRLSGIGYPSGRTVAYSFDALGRVSAISTTGNGQTQQVVSNVAYHPFGGVKSYTLGNGQQYSRSYDQDGRISAYTLGTKSFGVGYDAASRIEFISELGNPANSNNYGYDALDRLTSAVTPGTPFSYSYDAVGNRLSKTAGSASDTLTYSPTSNRIATLTPASGPPRSFAFDPNGSTTADGNNTYAYDARGRMVQATSVLGTSTYQVNALGQRIRKTNSLGDTVFHYDSGGRLIAETDPAGALKRELLYLGDIPVGVVQ